MSELLQQCNHIRIRIRIHSLLLTCCRSTLLLLAPSLAPGLPLLAVLHYDSGSPLSGSLFPSAPGYEIASGLWLISGSNRSYCCTALLLRVSVGVAMLRLAAAAPCHSAPCRSAPQLCCDLRLTDAPVVVDRTVAQHWLS